LVPEGVRNLPELPREINSAEVCKKREVEESAIQTKKKREKAEKGTRTCP